MDNDDRLHATEKRGNREGEEEEIRRRGTALDAYHQRELNSSNRSKKHPWVGKGGNVGGEGKGKQKKDGDVGGGGGRASNQTTHMR